MTTNDLLREAIDAWPAFDTENDHVGGADLVEWFAAWRERAKQSLSSPAPTDSTPAAPAPDDAVDAARWRALMSSQRLHFMGCAGVDLKQKEGTEGRKYVNLIPIPRPGEYWHFGMEFWSQHPAHNDPAHHDTFERAFMVAYTDAMIAKGSGQ